MRKVITICLLLLFISSNAVFIGLYVSFNFLDPENAINQTYRRQVLHYPFLRKILRLEQVGDARYDYMYFRDLPLTIHLFYQEDVSLSEETTQKILNKMQLVTHKYVPGTFSGPLTLHTIPTKVNDEDLKKIRDTYAQQDSLWRTSAPLNIFVLNYYTPHPSYAGLVEDAHSIFLFKQAIENVAATPELIPAIESSTILHEFGHLGGAEHINIQGCIMIDKVENLDFYNKIPTIPDTYCDDDLIEIQHALQ